MPAIPSLPEQHIQAICDVLADTSEGLTGSEIGRLLGQCSIEDPSPGSTKRYRLFEALSERQREDGCANNVFNFIQIALDPVRFVDNTPKFEQLRCDLNLVLLFSGYEIGKDGCICRVSQVYTLSEAEQRAGRLRSALESRCIHPDVLRYCRAELLRDNYFHAVLEATKSAAEKIRQKSGLKSDGSNLVDDAFGLNKGPILAINTLQTESERSEHTGFMNLMKGMFGLFRNPTAHAPKITCTIDEQDALDLLTILSFIHRRLDKAVRTGMNKIE
jgi:uncharacterized protein (TIGR02391 family)